MTKKPSLRANGSAAPSDDRLREAIQSVGTTALDCVVALLLNDV